MKKKAVAVFMAAVMVVVLARLWRQQCKGDRRQG